MLPENQISQLYKALGNRIRQERDKRGHTQTKFADLIQISRASLVNIEKGRQRPPLHILYSISKILDIRLSLLLPKVEEIEESEINKKLLDRIRQKSKGDNEFEESLIHFIKHTSNKIK